MNPGYTQKQADRLKHEIDSMMALVEDHVGALGRIVSDTAQGGFFGVKQLEELREEAEALKAIVDRRTRRG